MYTYEYPRPALTVDCVIFYNENDKQNVLLIKRANEPFKDYWAFPGGFVDMDEDIPDAAHRELEEETGLICSNLKQFACFGGVNRDPRGRTVSVVYYGSVSKQDNNVLAADDAAEAQWFCLDNLPKLAFDHEQILKELLKSL